MSNEAWIAYLNNDYKKSKELADKCIDKFGYIAQKEQDNLERIGYPKPPTGTVSDSVKSDIFSRSILNDVAFCWLIKGHSLFHQGKLHEAIEAYMETEKFSYARRWDGSWDGVWSQAEAAKSWKALSRKNLK